MASNSKDKGNRAKRVVSYHSAIHQKDERGENFISITEDQLDSPKLRHSATNVVSVSKRSLVDEQTDLKKYCLQIEQSKQYLFVTDDNEPDALTVRKYNLKNLYTLRSMIFLNQV